MLLEICRFVHLGLLHSKLLILSVSQFGGATVASGMLSAGADATAKESSDNIGLLVY